MRGHMCIAILDDINNAYNASSGVRRLRDRAEVQIFTKPFGDPSVLRDFDALIANRGRTRFTRELLEQLLHRSEIFPSGSDPSWADDWHCFI